MWSRGRSLARSLRHAASTVRHAPAWTDYFRHTRARALLTGAQETVDGRDIPGYRSQKMARLEAVLVTANDPLNTRRIVKAANLRDSREAKQLLEQLQDFLEADDAAFRVENVAGGWQLRTRKEFASWIDKTQTHSSEQRLSQPAMETLSIVAYRQPVLRADIESIRGVACGEMIRQLIERGFVKIVGHHDSLGRPRLYGTTRKFLEMFGLGEIEDLPHSREMGLNPVAVDDEQADMDDEFEDEFEDDDAEDLESELIEDSEDEELEDEDEDDLEPESDEHVASHGDVENVDGLIESDGHSEAVVDSETEESGLLARVRRASKLPKSPQEDQ